LLVQRPAIHHREAEPPSRGQVTEHHVLGHRERGDQVQLLRDQREPRGQCFVWIPESARGTVDEDAARILSSVDLPARFSPTIAWTSPAASSSETWSRAEVAKKRLLSRSATTTVTARRAARSSWDRRPVRAR